MSQPKLGDCIAYVQLAMNALREADPAGAGYAEQMQQALDLFDLHSTELYVHVAECLEALETRRERLQEYRERRDECPPP